ncbi:protein Mis18-alpha isoform 2-T2 [Glossophaga mutica]
MAGIGSEESCKGCSSASCACGETGTWSDPSLLSQRLSEGSSRHKLLQQQWTSTWDSLSGAASVAERTRREGTAVPSEDEDQPLVFLCAGCWRPLGDSLNWVTCQEDNSCILLRRVSSNVSVDKEQILSKRENENGCYVLGSSVKQIVSEDKEVFNLESRIVIENSLKQMEDVLKVLQAKLWDVEAKLAFPGAKG